MKRYDYETRSIVEFTNKTKASYSKKRYGDLLHTVIEQSILLDKKLYNPYVTDGDVIKILYWDRNKIVDFLIDKEDLYKVQNNYWTMNHNGYVWSRSNDEKTYLHWIIMGQKYNSKVIIDHINNNPLDNRKINLRFTDFRGNNTNQIGQEFKGVNKTCDKKGWRARWRFYGEEFAEHFYGEDSFEKASEYRLKMMKETNYLRTCND